MRADEFVTSLKREVRQSVAATLGYIADPPVPQPPAHLGEFARWWQGLSGPQRDVARRMMEYVAEGSLFAVLNVLDGVASLQGQDGAFELFHCTAESRTRLNAPEGDFLYDLFNNTA